MTKRFLTTQKFVNLSADPSSGVAGEVYYNTTYNCLRFYNGSSWQNFVSNLDAISDVDINSPSTNQVLGYDGSTQTWKNISQTGGGGGGTSEANMAYTFWFGV
jgi:hypothetical protein